MDDLVAAGDIGWDSGELPPATASALKDQGLEHLVVIAVGDDEGKVLGQRQLAAAVAGGLTVSVGLTAYPTAVEPAAVAETAVAQYGSANPLAYWLLLPPANDLYYVTAE